MMCLMALTMQAQKTKVATGYTDLGLPSGTIWKNFNATGFYTYDDAVKQFGSRLPSKAQWEELKAECQWLWTGNGYKVIGPNGKYIVLPALGYCGCDGMVILVGSYGYYLSSTDKGYAWGTDWVWYLRFNSDSFRVGMYSGFRCGGYSVRLVQKK